LQYDQKTRFVGEFMTKVDGGSMYHSIEARSPFLDSQLWEFAAVLPPQARLHGGVLKAILREIVRKRIGPQVAFRKKQGFTVPVEQWLATRWKSILEEMAQDSLLEREGWLSPGRLSPAVQEGIGRGSIPTQLWYLLVLEHWRRRGNSV
jgi:asparagine synthase (glutamine-hydrolysing)